MQISRGFFSWGIFFLGDFFLSLFTFHSSLFTLLVVGCLFCCRARGVGRLPRRRYSLRVRADSGLRSAPRYSIHPHYPSLHTISTVCPLHKPSPATSLSFPRACIRSFRAAVYLRCFRPLVFIFGDWLFRGCERAPPSPSSHSAIELPL